MQQVKALQHFDWLEYSHFLPFLADAIAKETNEKFRFCCKDKRSWIHADHVE